MNQIQDNRLFRISSRFSGGFRIFHSAFHNPQSAIRHWIPVIWLVVVGCLVLLLLSPAIPYAQEYRFLQGGITLKGVNYFLVNEGHRVYFTDETVVKNREDKEIPLSVLREGKWVYVEGPLNSDGSIDAETIYLIPGHIPKRDRGRYPFMQLPF